MDAGRGARHAGRMADRIHTERALPGLSTAAVEFYRDLEEHNDRDWWRAHRTVYEMQVREPVEEIVELLAVEYDATSTKVFRPQRDVRFSSDKSPYKTHQGGYLGTAGGSAHYVQISGDGLMASSGMYRWAPDQLARYRAAVAEDTSGNDLVRILSDAGRAGLAVGGEQLATRPRGVSPDHPRLDLLRRRALHLGIDFGVPGWLGGDEVLDHVREAWDAGRPLVAWLDQCVGPTELPRR